MKFVLEENQLVFFDNENNKLYLGIKFNFDVNGSTIISKTTLNDLFEFNINPVMNGENPIQMMQKLKNIKYWFNNRLSNYTNMDLNTIANEDLNLLNEQYNLGDKK